MDFAITKMSSKGQVVIPADMRFGINEGDKLLLIKDQGNIIIKNAKELRNSLKEDLIFAKRTEAAWKSYERGEFTEMDYDEFLKEIKKW
jgi:AbrB family looped-hinge helix DNA binding protein